MTKWRVERPLWFVAIFLACNFYLFVFQYRCSPPERKPLRKQLEVAQLGGGGGQDDEEKDVLFHLLRDGKTVKGSALVFETNFVEMKKFSLRQVKSVHKKLVTYLSPKGCKICKPRDQCVSGTLEYWGALEESAFKAKKFHRQMMYDSAAFYGRILHETLNLLMRTVVFECRLERAFSGLSKAHDQKLEIRIPWREAEIFAPVVQIDSAWHTNPELVVCSRALYGNIDGRALALFVDYYKNQGATQVVIYDVGMAQFRNLEILEPFKKSGILKWVDLKDELIRVYGYLYVGALLRSKSVGQVMTKHLCNIYAEQIGTDWVLHLDMDELIAPGQLLFRGRRPKGRNKRDVAQLEKELTPEERALQKKLQQTGKSTKNQVTVIDLLRLVPESFVSVSFGSLQVNASVDSRLCDYHREMDPQDTLTKWSWFDHARRTSSLHIEVEQREPWNFFHCDAKRCDDCKRCIGATGSRKVALRPNGVSYQKGLMLHEASFVTDEYLALDLSTDMMYIRHYRCLNNIKNARHLRWWFTDDTWPCLSCSTTVEW